MKYLYSRKVRRMARALANNIRESQRKTGGRPMATTRLFAREDWAEWMIEWHAEGRCEITEELFEEYLDVLPPAFMRKRVQLADGSEVYAQFGFVEGADRITAFWREKTDKPGEYRYFCQYTNLWSKG